VQRLDPVFMALAPGRGDVPRTPSRDKLGGTAEEGYIHCGSSGAGHGDDRRPVPLRAWPDKMQSRIVRGLIDGVCWS
jgi:hypothetical protein